MNPLDVIIWSCVVVFITTAGLTLLHVSGMRSLPDRNQAKVLFKSLIVEIVVVAVAAFARELLKSQKSQPESSPNVNAGMIVSPEAGKNTVMLPHVQDDAKKLNDIPTALPDSKNEYEEITIWDYTKHPPASRIERIYKTK
jgi:hypothetical protein